MRLRVVWALFILPVLLVLVCVQSTLPQAGEICREFGVTPSRDLDDSGRLASFVFGRIALLGVGPDAKHPQIIAQYSDSGQPGSRQRVGRSGNYCFRRYGAGATVVVEIDGLEAARRTVPEASGTQQREDFEIDLSQSRRASPPGIVSVATARPPNPKTVELYERAITSEREGQTEQTIDTVNEIVRIDPTDFVAWAKLGGLYQTKGKVSEAETSFKRALAIRNDYIPALLNFGLLKALSGEYPAAIELFRLATKTDPSHARAFRFLGEAYLQNRQGALGLEALDKALTLDPDGMAECHLLKARLFDLVGAKREAAEEYRSFLKKVPKFKDKGVLESYIKANGN
jgi:tetratricopeptide (TPR) repeat protein